MCLKDSDRKQADEQGYPAERGVKNLEPASQCTRQCEYVNTYLSYRQRIRIENAKGDKFSCIHNMLH